jgi:hypothetical protein
VPLLEAKLAPLLLVASTVGVVLVAVGGRVKPSSVVVGATVSTPAPSMVATASASFVAPSTTPTIVGR